MSAQFSPDNLKDAPSDPRGLVLMICVNLFTITCLPDSKFILANRYIETVSKFSVNVLEGDVVRNVSLFVDCQRYPKGPAIHKLSVP